MIVVDSSVWIDFFAARVTEQTDKLKRLESPANIVVGDIILLEVLRGARDDAQARRYEREFRSFKIRSFLDPELAVAGASIYRSLRAKGLTVRKAPDLIIATYCIENNLPLLHRDRDFSVLAEHVGLKEL